MYLSSQANYISIKLIVKTFLSYVGMNFPKSFLLRIHCEQL